MDDDNHDRDDTTKNTEQKSSENEGPAALNSKLSQGFVEISQGGSGGGDDDGSISTGNDEPQLEQVVCRTGESSSIPATVGMDTEAPSPPQTLATLPSTDDLHWSSVNGDAEVPPVECGLQQSVSAEEFKDQVSVPKKEERISNADQTARAQSENLQETPNGTLSSELSPTSVTQFVSSMPSPVQTEQKMSTVKNRNISHLQEVGIKSSFNPKKLSVVSVQKTPSTDGYNWRKYGQKQVKSPQGFRSYYRCTHADCYAKKIECSDDFNRVTEIVYKSQHSHDPPQKINCTRGSRLSSSVAPVNGIASSVGPTAINTDSVPSTSSIDSIQKMPVVPEPEQKESSPTDDIAETVVKHGHVDETEPRKRLKKTDSSCSESLPKAGKKSKYVVHAAGDVGISGDGYRWRKYGQKMVKGNPHPRNYYRCTSAGCPVRKHIERARDNTNAAIITYKGVHNHDVPIPKKRQCPASSPLVSAAASASMNTTQVVKPENTANQVSATQCSVDKEGELKGQTLECGGEKAVDSTRTLLSIGFEIKHY